MKIKNLLLTGMFAMALIGCSSDDDDVIDNGNGNGNENEETLAYEDGILILNEGGIGNSNASVSFVSEDLSQIENNIFSSTNGTALGDVAQSIGFHEDEAYIVVNNSNKIEVVERNTFGSISTITEGLDNPRYFATANGKAYVTNWGDPFDPSDDYVAVINLENATVESTISVSEGPERILEHNGSLYVSHLGGYNTNNVVSVIDGNMVSEIEVNDNPDEMLVDEAGNLWVLSQGITDWSGEGNDTAGAIVKINPTTNTVEQSLEFETTNHPDLMVYDNGNIYYSAGGGIYEIENTATSLATEPILNGYFYGIEVRDGYLYATDSGDFSSGGEFMVYDLSTGTEVTSHTAGIGSGKIYFN